MPRFDYKIRDSEGRTLTGSLEAESVSAAAQSLRSAGAAVLDVRPSTGKDSPGANGPVRLPSPAHPAWLLPVTSFDVELGIWQLSSMLRSGLSILAALETVAAQSRRPRAARAWLDIRERIQRGESLGDAMERHRRMFGPYIVQLVRVGERSGEMDTALARAAEHLASHRDIRMMVVNALIYPAITLLMAVGVSAYLVLSVIPKVSDFLASGGADLPAATQSLVDFAGWLRANGLAVLAVAVAAVCALYLLRRHPTTRDMLDAAALRIPPFGRILRLSGTAVFARGLGLLIESGVSLLDALHVVSQLLGNSRLSRRVEEAAAAVVRGGSLAESLSSAPEFLPMLPRMTAVAENTGTLAETMAEVAGFHERMLVLSIKRLSSTVEPVVIVFTGVVVGYVYIAFFMALFSMANAV